MQTLHSLLLGRGMSCGLSLCENESEIRRLTKDPAGLVVLDARDFSPEEFSAKVIALDNRSPSRAQDKRSVYHDTIPHPDAADVLGNCLIDPAIAVLAGASASSQADPSIRNDEIVIYAGRQALPAFLSQFAASHPGACIFRELELSRAAFLDRLARAAAVVSYFGMTILEAMYLRKPAALFSINSEIHDKLSLHLQEQCAVPFVRSIPELENALIGPPSQCVPGKDGYNRLIALIEKTAEAA